MIDFYDRRTPHPSLDFVQRAGQALGVSVAELAGEKLPPQTATRRNLGPQSQLQRKFKQICNSSRVKTKQ